MDRVYHLSSCSTCQRILKETNAIARGLELVDIKFQNVSSEELDRWAKVVGSYEALFSKRAVKFRQQGWHEQQLTETQYRNLMLEEYTFLKRPVFVIGEQVFVGNQKKTIAEVLAAF